MTNHDELCEKDVEKDFHGLFSSELHELRKENKELRARNAELESLNSFLNGQNKELSEQVLSECLKRDKENSELRTRVAELEKEKEGLKKEIVDYIEASGKLHRREIQDMKDFKRQFTDVVIESLGKENKELQNRLSTLEKKLAKETARNYRLCTVKRDWQNGVRDRIKGLEEYQKKVVKEYNDLWLEKQQLEGYQKTYFEKIDAERVAKIIELEKRLSTLLKASEGMEKALEVVMSVWQLQRKVNQPTVRESFECEIEAKQALADFRAVKEVAGNG